MIDKKEWGKKEEEKYDDIINTWMNLSLLLDETM